MNSIGLNGNVASTAPLVMAFPLFGDDDCLVLFSWREEWECPLVCHLREEWG
jgi:hypothetical protein